MLVLEIKRKKLCFIFLKGHQNSGAPTFFGAFFLYYEPVCAGNALIKLENIGDTLSVRKKDNQNPDAGSLD